VAAKSGLHLPADWSDLVKVSMKFLTVAAYAFKAISFLFCILCAVAMVQKQTFFFFFLSSLTTCFNIHASFPFFFLSFSFTYRCHLKLGNALNFWVLIVALKRKRHKILS
jgi:hypothetical protein